jgi:hypothetical protein
MGWFDREILEFGGKYMFWEADYLVDFKQLYYLGRGIQIEFVTTRFV